MNKSTNPTVGQWLLLNTKQLSEAGIRSARLDCVILLEHRLNLGRASILAHLDDTLTDEVLKKLTNDIALRVQHKPIQYITGYTEFYGRKFFVSENVLVPRPESESIISLLKLLPNNSLSTIIDIGTGSGCLAITAKLEFPKTEVIAIDIDSECLDVTQANASKLGAKIATLESNLTENLPALSPDVPIIIIANLPYVPDDMTVNKAATHEPARALYGGEHGLDLYEQMWTQFGGIQPRPYAVICESLEIQHQKMSDLAARQGFTLKQTDGLVQLFLKS
jgi:release factor glutamine methyltransferase